jgi:hypothetical protein
MAAPDFVLNNFRWKLTALLLAMLSWFAIKFAIYKGIAGRNQSLRHQTVLVLKAPDDHGSFRVQPPEVDVTVQATKQLRGEDLEVFVNVAGMPRDVDSAFKQVQVRGPEVSKVVGIQPAPVVQVIRVAPLETSLTNSFKSP